MGYVLLGPNLIATGFFVVLNGETEILICLLSRVSFRQSCMVHPKRRANSETGKDKGDGETNLHSTHSTRQRFSPIHCGSLFASGVANVAALGGEPLPLGVVGDDDSGRRLLAALADRQAVMM